MSLVKRESDLEEGKYRSFDFALKILYDTDNSPAFGVVYIAERQNTIKRVELPIEISKDSLNPIKINFKPLEMSAVEGVHGPYTVEDLDGFFKEIKRKWELVTAIRKPEDSFLDKFEPEKYIHEYPELQETEYLLRISEPIRNKIRSFLTRENFIP